MSIPNVLTLAATVIFGSGVVVYGSIISTGGHNPTAAGFVYMQGMSGNPHLWDDGTVAVILPSAPSDAGVFAMGIDNLIPNTTYRFRAWAQNSDGISYGDTVSVKTSATSLPPPVSAATDRYWVGDGGAWGDTAHWSITSGGAGGAFVPTATENVRFDENSFTTTGQTVTADIAACKSIDFTGVTNNPAISITGWMMPNGDVTLTADATFPDLNISPEGTCNLTTCGSEINYLQVSDSVVVLQDDLTAQTINIFGQSGNCLLYANGKTVNVTYFYVDANNEPDKGGLIVNLDGSTINVNSDFAISSAKITISAIGSIINFDSGSVIQFARNTDDPDSLRSAIAGGAGSVCTIVAADGFDNYVRYGRFTNIVVTGYPLRAPASLYNIDGGGNSGIDFSSSYEEEIDDGLLLDDGVELEWTLDSGHYYEQHLLDATTAIDTEITNWNGMEVVPADTLDLEDYGTALRSFIFTGITEVLFAYEELRHGWLITNTESLVLADATSEILGLLISDWLTLTDAQTNNWNGREIVPDTLNLFDIAQGARVYTDTIDESLVATDSALLKLTVTILESLGFTELVTALKTMASTVSDGISATDATDHAYPLFIQEALSAVDANSVITTFVNALAENIGITDAASLIKRISDTVAESLVLSETVSTQGAFYSAVYDTLKMTVTVELNGEVYECYVLNTPKFMPSMYSGFDYNSYCVFENRAFGANATGIYELNGSTDAGATIHTGAILSETDFGAPNQKKFRRGYLGITGSSPVMVFEAEDGTRQAYSVDTQGKIVASSELKSKKWKLSVADFDELSTIKLLPIILTK